jgi:hypothetical protein
VSKSLESVRALMRLKSTAAHRATSAQVSLDYYSKLLEVAISELCAEDAAELCDKAEGFVYPFTPKP